MLKVYANSRFQVGIGDRQPFEAAYPDVRDKALLLDVADIVLMGVREIEHLREHSRSRRSR